MQNTLRRTKNRRGIYTTLAVGALLSMLLPTVVLCSPAGRKAFSFNNIIGVNLWLIVLWLAALAVPLLIVFANNIGARDNSRLNTVLFSTAAVFTLIIYPIVMQILFMTGNNLAGISGIGSAGGAGITNQLGAGLGSAGLTGVNLASGAGAGLANGVGAGIGAGAINGAGAGINAAAGAGEIGFRMGIGTILSGVFLVLGLILALWSSFANRVTLKEAARATGQQPQTLPQSVVTTITQQTTEVVPTPPPVETALQNNLVQQQSSTQQPQATITVPSTADIVVSKTKDEQEK